MYLSGDIGGTKTHLACYEESSNECIKNQIFLSRDYSDLSVIIKEFFPSSNKIDVACFGIAGPINNGVCNATNLPWVIDAAMMSKNLGIAQVFLINDLEANAYGLKTLSTDEIFILNEGCPNAKGNRVLISAGTGLGEAGLFFDGKEHLPFVSEGGHVDFAPRNEEDVKLLYFLQKKFGHVSYERVLSGPGLSNIYEYLSHGKKMEPKEITKHALNGTLLNARKALEWFVSFYGSECANSALKFMALGGVYLGGGIAPKILSEIKKGGFMKAFRSKGRFESLLSTIPIRIVLNEDTALLGAKLCALKKISK